MKGNERSSFQKPKYKLIYVMRINDERHSGCLKIGDATIGDGNVDALSVKPNSTELNDSARRRIDQYTKTAGIPYDLLYTEAAVCLRNNRISGFRDTDVHNVLKRSDIINKDFEGGTGHGTEWYITDLMTVINAIQAVKEGRESLNASQISRGKSPIVFRPEQRDAIEKTKKQFRHGNQMLWNAKMRFGKTLSALQVVKEMGFGRTLILTHRPVVDSGWFEDFNKIFYDDIQYVYGSKSKGSSFLNLENQHCEEGKKYVYFASEQDLRDSKRVKGNFDKNDEVFSASWDLIIVDEAHEGMKTSRGLTVLKELKKPLTKVLQLSGTPYNLLSDFNEGEIYTWDYVMEQKAKAEWDINHFGDPNPYAELPRLNIFTYNLGKLVAKFADEEAMFNFSEFFKVNVDGKFIHEDDVAHFLNLLTKEDDESMYPYSNEEYRDIFRHTLWVLPGVKAAKALSSMLQSHQVFQHFKIVNVAGDGDDDAESGKALDMVKKAIGDNPDETRTITLTRSRLTTGVTVKPWTGVFMLYGSSRTAASAYMQTIFRVQSPATINGRTKEECYVFDFAPDRTLQVLAKAPRIPTETGNTTEDQKRALAELLNFCPVISIDGSKMTRFNETKLLQHLKRVYVEKVVQSGFNDSHLYNDELMKLNDIDMADFQDLMSTLKKTKAIPATATIDINSQGLTDEQYEEKKNLGNKKIKDRTPEEQARLDELNKKAKSRADVISVLRGISIRMPLLIYGAEIKDETKDLAIRNFTQLVDDQSWGEFMPDGVTKDKFAKFIKYYDPEIFSASAKRIRDMIREADTKAVEDRIKYIATLFSTFRNPDKETVLTPWRVVNMHLGDTLGGYCFFDGDYKESIEEPRFIDKGEITDDVFSPETRLLEINSKTGLYPLYLAYTLYRRRLENCKSQPSTREKHLKIWDEVVRENIFVICKTPMAKSITKRTLVGFRDAEVNTRYFENLVNQIKNKPNNFLRKVVQGNNYWKANNNDNMKFNAVVGNPPYQEEGISKRKAPVYNYFMDASFKLSDRVTLITPGRFLFKAGQTNKDWANRILTDDHIKVVKYFKKSIDVFPYVDIKGGVVITLRDTNYDFGAIGVFNEYEELANILQKVSSHKDFIKGEFANTVSPQGLYKFTDALFKDYPQAKEVQGKGTGAKITSNSLENLPEVFLSDEPDGKDAYIKMIGRSGKQRVTRWIKRSYVQQVDSLDFYKVFVPEGNGTGAIGEVLSTPVIGLPVIGHTDTFLTIGKFDTMEEAGNCLKYIKTKFARTMLGTLKATQHNTRGAWENVPVQDFSFNSDIDWSKSVADIDKQLYRKYALSGEEIRFIEQMIKPM